MLGIGTRVGRRSEIFSTGWARISDIKRRSHSSLNPDTVAGCYAVAREALHQTMESETEAGFHMQGN